MTEDERLCLPIATIDELAYEVQWCSATAGIAPFNEWIHRRRRVSDFYANAPNPRTFYTWQIKAILKGDL